MSSSAAKPCTPPLQAAGQVSIDLRWAAGKIADCRVATRRPAATRLLVGQTAEQALTLLPRLFSLCRHAQHTVAEAALRAAGAPLAATRDPDASAATLLREAIGEHLWRLLIDWPARLTEGEAGGFSPADALPSADGDSLRSAHGDSLQSSHRDSLRSQNKTGNATFALWYRRLRGHESDADLAAALAGVCPRADLQRLLDALLPWERPLEVDSNFLPELDPALAGELFSQPAAGFAAQPNWRGQPQEVGAAARFADHPEVTALRHAGRPLAARLLARWLALQADIARLGKPAGPAVEARTVATGTAFAWADTARGPLCHRVVLHDGRVGDYAVIAPTEWNFHPRQVWPQALCGAAAATPEIAENLLRLWALALDPCVPVQLNFIAATDKEN